MGPLGAVYLGRAATEHNPRPRQGSGSSAVEREPMPGNGMGNSLGHWRPNWNGGPADRDSLRSRSGP
jgi:hypothetical protein